MNPFRVLGLADNVSIDEAKVAWRHLRSKHHPDTGGSEAKFKEASEAWEAIEGGYRVAPPPAAPLPSTSFGNSPQPKSPYQATRPSGLKLPKTGRPYRNGKSVLRVLLQITKEQAARGCSVPFLHNDEILSYDVRPGASSHTTETVIQDSQVIGVSFGKTSTILIELEVIDDAR